MEPQICRPERQQDLADQSRGFKSKHSASARTVEGQAEECDLAPSHGVIELLHTDGGDLLEYEPIKNPDSDPRRVPSKWIACLLLRADEAELAGERLQLKQTRVHPAASEATQRDRVRPHQPRVHLLERKPLSLQDRPQPSADAGRT